ncbi:hypothetical protein AMAG_18764 [Allomyces macrogynus ATCC 38327]|uniref:FAD-binding FR-type domain-containing protein n=1 Tax=Allomyces macrogynus (strain ATCC 38327) TaxID=578462 RepID=A0A0L0SFM9_ALLM3|nr:hypothetical protein AMAG_18764 [Allomyces macrogynus ATCC 38327]|eukprot:KNE61306.1 hypothetical protein AMAG_18764 [Allomyces macrogynus ATCC 38327]
MVAAPASTGPLAAQQPYSAGSKIASTTVVFLVFFGYALSLWRDIANTFGPIVSKGGMQVAISWYYDGVFGLAYAVPLFLASAIVCVQYARTKAFYPLATGANAQRSPDRVLFWLRLLIILGNFWQFGANLGIRMRNLNMRAAQNPKQAAQLLAFWNVFEGVCRSAGFPVFWNMGWLFVLAMRSPAIAPLQASLGLAYEHTVGLHRTMGWATGFWLLWHSIGYVIVFIAEHETEHLLPGTTLGNLNFVGWIGTLLFLIMATTGLYQIRRRNYSLFAMLHWLWIPFMLCAVMHIPQNAMPILPTLALYIVDRLLLVAGAGAGFNGGTLVTATAVRVSDDVVALLIPVGPARSKTPTVQDELVDQDLAAMYVPGRFLCLTAPSLVPVAPASHPFSIATYSVPNLTVTIMIRALGPFTKTLHSAASRSGAPVTLRVSPPQSMPVLSATQSTDGVAPAKDNAYMELGLGGNSSRALIAGGVGVSKYLAAADARTSWNSLDRDDSKQGLFESDSGSNLETGTPEAGVPDTRKIWLCKSAPEFHMYQALGANLSGWDVFCKTGFTIEHGTRNAAAVNKEQEADLEVHQVLMAKGIDEDDLTDAPRSSYPLFGQRTAAPLVAWARLAVFVFMAGAYAAIYFGARTPTYGYAAADCKKVVGFAMWMRCSRWSSTGPYLAVLIGMPIATQLVMAILSIINMRVRAASVFRAHGSPSGPAIVGRPRSLVARRFEARADLGLDDMAQAKDGRVARLVREARAACALGSHSMQVRSCASKPVRSSFRRATFAANGEFVDDGIGL